MPMSLKLGPAVTIPGYTTLAPPDFDSEHEATIYPADGVVAYPAFWRFYLSGPLAADREAEDAFGVSEEDGEAMRALLEDPEHWPVVSLRLNDDAWLRIVFRNFEDDEGIDFVRHPSAGPAQVVAATDGQLSTLTWAQLVSIAERPDNRLSRAQRLMLMLPMLDSQQLPESAGQTLRRALEDIGAANPSTLAKTLLDNLAI